jgi:SAM-dependent methyltransferase
VTSDDVEARQRWNRRYAARAADTGPAAPTEPPARFLTDRVRHLPTVGRTLDVAGGAGRHAVWLAERGLTVTLIDVSDAACAASAARAADAGVRLEIVRADLGVDSLPTGPWDVVLVHDWLDRDVWRALPGYLAVGGVLLASQPTVTNLERHDRPGRRWLLDDGELARLVADVEAEDPALAVVELTEGWSEDDRHEARLVLQRTR